MEIAYYAGARTWVGLFMQDQQIVDYGARFLQGFCLGMQVGNPSPEQFVVGLTPECSAALPLLVETVVAELHRRGFPLRKK